MFSAIKTNLVNKRKLTLVFISAVLISCGGADKGNNTEPENTSCTTCKIYATATRTLGNIGGVSGADQICMTDASYPGNGTYKALIVDGVNRVASITADVGDGQVGWVLKPNTEYVLPDGTTIANSNSDGLFQFDLQMSLLGAGNDTNYWTGLNTNWQLNQGNHCELWSSDLNTGTGSFGSGNYVDSRAINVNVFSCDRRTVHLLCVEQ